MKRVFRLLLVLAVALATVVGPLPASGDPVPEVKLRGVGIGPATLRSARIRPAAPLRVCSPGPATMVGLTWEQEGAEPVEAFLTWGGPRPGEARLVSDPEHAPDPGPEAAGVREGTDPVWTGGARCVSLALTVPEDVVLRDARAVFVDTGAPSQETTGWLGPASASAAVPQPEIVTRAGWGADEDIKRCEPDLAESVRMAYVHHTAGSNAYSRAESDDIVRGIYAYHVEGRRFCDIAYNFLVDRFGTVYEGRSGGITEPVIGAHAQGFNTGSTGIAAMGIFTRRAPSDALLRSLKGLLAWRLDVAHVEPMGTAEMTSAGGSNQKYEEGEVVMLPAVSGHRDTGYTTCPGDRLYAKLPGLRRGAQRMGLPKIWDVGASAEEVRFPDMPVQLTADFSGLLEWTVTITDELGTPVRTDKGTSDFLAYEWNGTDTLGIPVAEGSYTITIAARDPATDGDALPATLSVLVLAPEL